MYKLVFFMMDICIYLYNFKKKVNTYNLERELFIYNLDMYISQKKGGNGFITSLPPFNWLKVRFGFWNVAVLKLTLGVGSFKKCEYV